MIKPEMIHTYGGEVETLAVDLQTGHLSQVSKKVIAQVPPHTGVNYGYDSSLHLLETNLPVTTNLPSFILRSQCAVTELNEHLRKQGIGLVSTAHHPSDNIQQSYQKGVLSKPIYDLLSGTRAPRFSLKDDLLQTVYGQQDWQDGRKWNHPIGTMSASVQPWNSLDFDYAPQQLAVLQSTAFMFNLLTANSPFVEGKATGLRDSRLMMWGNGGMIDTSRYSQERVLANNLPEQPLGYADYFRFVLGHQRPFVVPLTVKGGDSNYKTKFMAVIQTDLPSNYSVLDMLSAKSIKCVDIETGEVESIAPKLSMIFNGFDFLNFPTARFRINLPNADDINPSLFAMAIKEGNEDTLRNLLREGGIKDGGFVCAEGRIAATVLPTLNGAGWEEFNLPYVLQTALIRAHKPVMQILHQSGLSWKELSNLHKTTNNIRTGGFDTTLKSVKAVDLAKKIWSTAKTTLTSAELALVGGSIDRILTTKTAPAEKQIMFVSQRGSLKDIPGSVFLDLIHHQLMVR